MGTFHLVGQRTCRKKVDPTTTIRKQKKLHTRSQCKLVQILCGTFMRVVTVIPVNKGRSLANVMSPILPLNGIDRPASLVTNSVYPSTTSKRDFIGLSCAQV